MCYECEKLREDLNDALRRISFLEGIIYTKVSQYYPLQPSPLQPFQEVLPKFVEPNVKYLDPNITRMNFNFGGIVDG